MLKKSTAKIYRYLRFRKGFGVHSPFAFGLINKVIEEKKPFYAFEEIEAYVSNHFSTKGYSQKYGRLLFRLVHFFHAQSVLQIGITNGMSPLYLNAASKHLIILESDMKKVDSTLAFYQMSSPLRVIPGDYEQTLNDAITELGALDILYLNIAQDPELTRALFEKCLPYTHPKTVCIIDGIHKKRMKTVWEVIKQRQDIPITMDLYSLGLVFLDRKMHKKNYKIFF